ncbi:MAG: MBL fold metallo-hydrolase, partial [Clostridia bacterium]|nr:MBL fold metallo-hydrolase [Clostridia bacterium]
MAKKTVKKQVKKAAKKYPFLVFIAFLLIVAIVGCYVLHMKGIIHIPFLKDTESSQSEGSSSNSEDIETEELSIHFLELGNKYTGDCTLIKVGDTEVLIDAGSRKGSAETIVPYVQQYCTDGVLEYVIATHAHQDHIAGFVG